MMNKTTQRQQRRLKGFLTAFGMTGGGERLKGFLTAFGMTGGGERLKGFLALLGMTGGENGSRDSSLRSE